MVKHNKEILDLNAWDALRRRYDASDDRSCVILCASYLDDCLYLLFQDFLLGNKRTREGLLNGMAPLSSFSARIKLAFSLNLIPDTVYSDLERVRDVRNAFAHQIADLTFASDPIKAICLALEFPLDYLGPEDIYHLRDDPRQYFIFTCGIVSMLLEPHGRFYKCAQEMKEKIQLNTVVEASSESSA